MGFEYKKKDWDAPFSNPTKRFITMNSHIFDMISENEFKSVMEIYIESGWTGWTRTMKAIIEEAKELGRIEKRIMPDAFTIGKKTSFASIGMITDATVLGKESIDVGAICTKTVQEAEILAGKWSESQKEDYGVYGIIFDIDIIIENADSILSIKIEKHLKNIYEEYTYEHTDKIRRLLYDATVIDI